MTDYGDILLPVEEWSMILKTGQYGRFYVVNEYPDKFDIFICKKDNLDIKIIMYGKQTKDEFGWMYDGSWVDDFYKILEDFKEKSKDILIKTANYYNKFLNDYVWEEHGIKQDKEYWVVRE